MNDLFYNELHINPFYIGSLYPELAYLYYTQMCVDVSVIEKYSLICHLIMHNGLS